MYTFDQTSGDWLTRSREIDRLIVDARRARATLAAQALGGCYRGLAALAGRLIDGLRQWQERRAIAAQLGGMTDHELSDIGLTRCDIEAVVNGRFRGERGRGIRRRPLLVGIAPAIRRVPVEVVKSDRIDKAA